MPKIDWYKDDILLIKDKNYLKIDKITHSEAGTYTCQGENELGEKHSDSITISVVRKPEILIPNNDQNIFLQPDESSDLDCVLSAGDVPVEISWSKNEKEVLKKTFFDIKSARKIIYSKGIIFC